jgi:Flp pilus assembly pilin Flp
MRHRSPALGARFLADASGAATVELALTLTFLLLPLIGVFDTGVYVFQRMEVENAAEMALQSAFNICGQGGATAPLITNCTGLSGAVTKGAHSTSLGSNVSVSSTTEGDYCVSGTGQLTTSGCGTTAHYLKVTVAFTFTPLFPNVSVASVLGNSIGGSRYMRMG